MPAPVQKPNLDNIASRKKGFELKFKSTQTFTQLINSHKVTLYFVQKDQSWIWRNRWQKVPQPARYYPMHEGTVPQQYYHPTQKAGHYAVALPKTTEQQIQRLSTEFKSGSLNINQLSNVEHSPFR